MALGCALRFGVGGSVLVVGCLWSVGISWGYVGPSWGRCCPSLKLCRPILELCWPILGLCWPILGAMCFRVWGLRFRVGRSVLGVHGL